VEPEVDRAGKRGGVTALDLAQVVQRRSSVGGTRADHLSGGRAEFGLGAGWVEEEFVAFGYDFPAVPERLDRLEEGAQIVRKLLKGEPVTFPGRFHQLRKAVCAPRPLQATAALEPSSYSWWP
jgi:hypothetical protein